MATIRYQVEADAKFLTKRWGGELIESDLVLVLISTRENQLEADCKALCSYCRSDGYSPARRKHSELWTHTALSDSYIPAEAPCDAYILREAWFCDFAPTPERLAKECAENIMREITERQGFDTIWHDIKPPALEEIKSDWAKIIKTAIETYQREGVN